MGVLERFEAKFEKTPGCWVWEAGRFTGGYGAFWQSPRTQLAHRIAWRFYRGSIPDGLDVLHHCDNPPCVNPKHLFLGTDLDNARDKEKKGRGRHTKGEQQYGAKLTNVQVLEIRNLLQQGQTQTEIGNKFGVNHTIISDIKLRKHWAHV